MSSGRHGGAFGWDSKPEEVAGWRKWLRGAEDAISAFALLAAVAIPLLEIVLRAVFQTGLTGASAFVQHFTLIIGMMGGALAARDGRLLSLSTVVSFLKGKAKSFAEVTASALSAVISVLLCLASIEFLRTEEKSLAFGIPVWAVQLVLPIGFGLIAWRLVWRASERWVGRALAAALSGGILALLKWVPLNPETMMWPGIGTVLAAAVLGAPIFAIIGGITLVLLWGIDMPVAAIPLKHYSLVTNPSLPTIPLFTLAGYFLAEGGASKRLIRVFHGLVGRVRGGAAVVVVLVCAFFTSFTGASGVTILALGGLLLPVLRSSGYSERSALGLMTGSGSLGVLFPPCLPLILYAIIASNVVANLDVESAMSATIGMKEMFLAGAIPGALLLMLTGGLGIWQGPRDAGAREPFDLTEAWASVWEAKWELLLPVVALAALFSGYATPVEAAAVTAAYSLFVETVIYRDLKLLKDVPRVLTECGLLVGGVLLILGVAMGFTNYLVLEQIPERAVEWVTETIENPLLFLLVLNLFLLLVGCLMDIYSAIVVVVPLIVPMGVAFGIDPIHLGIIFLANLQLGYLTPPVGMNLFLSSYRFEVPIGQVIRSVLPILLVLAIGVLLITYVPFLSTALPRLLE